MKNLFTSLFLILIPFLTASPAKKFSHGDVKTALRELDRELAQRHVYTSIRQHRLDSLFAITQSADIENPDILPILMELGDNYDGYIADSAKAVFERGERTAQALKQPEWEIRFRLKKLVNMTLSGFGHEAAHAFESISTDSLPDSIKVAVFDAGRQLYSYQSSFYHKQSESYKAWHNKSVEMLRRLLETLPDTTEEYYVREGEFYRTTGHNSEAKAELSEYLDRPQRNPKLSAIAANLMAQIMEEQDNTEGQLYYLAKSAIADIRNATRETVSLHELGAAIFENGDLERAHKYLNIALSDAVECNASMRMIQASGALPVIAEAHRMEQARRRTWSYIVITAMGGLVIGLFVMSMRLRREMKRMQILQDGLASANKMKEMYISQFLNLCTTYMDKLHQFCKIAERKMSTGHTDELYKLVTSGRFAEEQSQEFYNTFDRAFLHIYPNFIEEVNRLLRPGEKIELAEGELLNTDLRILAFMRLGVEESTRIAQVLNYSVHTIYSYRNRLKNRAINRDTLEKDVMKIGQISI